MKVRELLPKYPSLTPERKSSSHCFFVEDVLGMQRNVPFLIYCQGTGQVPQAKTTMLILYLRRRINVIGRV
jgi:hypothetical protein